MLIITENLGHRRRCVPVALVYVTTESAGATVEMPDVPTDVRARHAALAEEVEGHRQRYYFATPTISDGEFDTLMHQLEAIEAEFPALRTPDSPTQKVGAPVTEPGAVEGSWPPIEHLERLLSLDNALDRKSTRLNSSH